VETVCRKGRVRDNREYGSGPFQGDPGHGATRDTEVTVRGWSTTIEKARKERRRKIGIEYEGHGCMSAVK
jgi:hypothetical protein